MTRWNASSARPPWATGSVSGPIMSRNSSERARVGVDQQQRGRVRLGRADVQEVHGLAVDLGPELGHGVDPLLLGAPVELAPPRDHVAQVADRGAVVPAVAGGGGGEAGLRQPAVQVVQGLLGDVHLEGRISEVGAGLCGGHGRYATTGLGTFRSSTLDILERCRKPPPDCSPCSACCRPGTRWTGAELAARLDVTGRTVRNDIDRLRELGYPVDAARGPGGYYRLGVGATLPPLLLDDEEAVAVAVGLHAAGGISGIEETRARALTKLEHVLPHRLRRQVGGGARGHDQRAGEHRVERGGSAGRRRAADRGRRGDPGHRASCASTTAGPAGWSSRTGWSAGSAGGTWWAGTRATAAGRPTGWTG